MYKLYDFLPSGTAYKVRLLLSHLGIPFQRVEVDLLGGETRSAAYRALNPVGKVPALVAADGTVYRESNAILLWLAKGTPYLPADDARLVRVLEWLFFEQNQIEPSFGSPRYWITILGEEDAYADRIALCHEAGARVLALMEADLANREFIVGDGYTIADIAVYAYTHVAAEGGYDLGPYPNIRAWFDRVAAQPRHVPITQV